MQIQYHYIFHSSQNIAREIGLDKVVRDNDEPKAIIILKSQSHFRIQAAA